MKLTEDDLSAQTEVRVHLDVWLKRYEWEEILENQKKAEKYLAVKTINHAVIEENKQLIKTNLNYIGTMLEFKENLNPLFVKEIQEIQSQENVEN